MTQRQLKTGYFFLEGLNAFATTFYFYYLFFLLQSEYGFGNLGNLVVSALNGFVCLFASFYGGRFAQKKGYFCALKIGFALIGLMMVAGVLCHNASAQIVIMVVWSIGLCFTWPTLEALVSERETPAGLSRMIGIYNVVWAGGGALAYFVGGAVLEKLGMRSLFLVPLAFHLLQIGLTLWLEKKSVAATQDVLPLPSSAAEPLSLNPRPIAKAKTFLRMAWLANPFAYVAINTVIPLIPDLASKLELSPAQAGFFCSIWFFARLGTFILLWLWAGWHYRFGFLLGAYLLLMASFAVLLLVVQFWVVLLAQIIFGLAIGLIYYSSLFYSMDVGETKGEHGGVHEAAIGAGIFVGPACGAMALRFFPEHSTSSIWAVSGLLLMGLAVLIWLRYRKK
ncbi:MAG: MFS transporter [Verrucomicrobia bacterium]|nr:MFS transporter [Verrucomicrobiota bacterium]